MRMELFFKSVLEQDPAPIVLCDLEHTILYMNPTAVQRYASRGGAGLIGKSLLDCHNPNSCAAILRVVDWFRANPRNNRVFTARGSKENKDIYMVALRDDAGSLIGYYEKHEYRDRETRKFYDF